MEPDFSGYATKNGLKCSDGRTIMPGAFKHNDQTKVPLVWQHQHNDPNNILGHVMLENRQDGVYSYGFFGSTESAKVARELVKHGDVTSLSIYANNLTQQGGNVMHGDIREVSLVLSGANPGAFIDNINIVHGDQIDTLQDEAVIYTGLDLEHGDIDDDEDSGESEEDYEDDENDDDSEDDESDDESNEIAQSGIRGFITNVMTSLDEEQAHVVRFILEDALSHGNADETVDPEEVQKVFATFDDQQADVVHYMVGEALAHADSQGASMATSTKSGSGSDTIEKTVQDVFDSMTDEQKNVVYYMIGEALQEDDEADAAENGGNSVAQSATYELDTDGLVGEISNNVIKHMEESGMSRNVFEQNGTSGKRPEDVLSHSQIKTIVEDAQRLGSLKESFLQHAQDYGVENIDVLFPEARFLTSQPEVLARRMEWVQTLLGSTKHSPFSRIKSTAVDLTADEARAKGYVKGNLKKDEIIKLLKRVTTPTTIYKKQRLDRDDVVDITDLDVIAWLKGEMRIMLDEELARAILVGDGRDADAEDKIDEDHLRPIAYDNDMYAHQLTLGDDTQPQAVVEAILRARRYYRGTGTPTMFTTDPVLTDLLLQTDKIGRRLYETQDALASALRVSDIVTVQAMDDYQDILAIIVNPVDYTIGADNGGDVSMFDNFDIDYNQFKYLIETRVSGALTKPKSALVIRRTVPNTVTPSTPSYNGTTHVISIPTVEGVIYSIDGVDRVGDVTIRETTDVEARAAGGYSLALGATTDWTYAYTA